MPHSQNFVFKPEALKTKKILVWEIHGTFETNVEVIVNSY